MNKLEKKALLSALIFILIEGIGMFTMYQVFGIRYSSGSVAKVLLYSQFALAIFAIVVNIKVFNNMGFGKLNKSQTKKWFKPFGLLMVGFLITSIITADWHNNVDYLLLVQTVIMTLFVGIAEEVMFRGIVLNTFLQNGNVKRAIFISATAFSLLHAVNIFGGVSILLVLPQLIMTFLFGLFFGWIAFKINNILPLIIYHWLWDLCVISSKFMGHKIVLFTVSAIIGEILVVIYFMKELKENDTKQIQ